MKSNDTVNNMMLKEIIIVHAVDEGPDTSYIGEYTNIWKDGCIDRKEKGDWNSHEYIYFLPANLDNEDDGERDYESMERLNRGDWCFIGIYAEAVIENKDSNNIQIIRSGGLWGIESYSDKEYIKEEERIQIEDLRKELESLNIDMSDFDDLVEYADVEYR